MSHGFGTQLAESQVGTAPAESRCPISPGDDPRLDDERGPRESLRMILSQSFRVLVANNALEALEILSKEAVAIATLDLDMPGMGGQDLMRRMHNEFPSTEIIVITGCGSIESAAESVRIGICDYIEKPFDVVKVGSAVARALARRRARTGLRSFLQELGSVVGRDQDASAIMNEVERSQKLRGRLSRCSRAGRRRRGARRGRRSRTLDFLEVLARRSRPRTLHSGHARACRSTRGCSPSAWVVGRDRQCGSPRSCTTSAGRNPDRPAAARGALDPNERQIVEQHPDRRTAGARPRCCNRTSRSRSAITTKVGWYRYPDGSLATRSRTRRASSRSPTRSTR